jgi:hypothetical protein
MRARDFKKKIAGFKDRDFKVTLGSIVEAEMRTYYIENKFGFLGEKLDSVFSLI